MYNLPNEKNLYIAQLRKKETTYDIIRANSCTPNIYKEAGIRSAVLTNLRNSNRVLEKKYGSELNRFILNKRGHNLTKMIKMEKNIKNKEYKKKKEGKIEKHSDEKRYLSSVTFDKRSKIHSIIRNITNNCGLPDYVKKPTVIGGKKLLSYAFSRKQMMSVLINSRNNI